MDAVGWKSKTARGCKQNPGRSRLSLCYPAENATRQSLRIAGLIQTSHEVEREEVFEKIENPPSRLARVGPATSVLEPWRDEAMLEEEFKATRLAWPLNATLLPGTLLHPGIGLPTWKAQQAVDGLLHGEATYVEEATALLGKAKGIVLLLPGDFRALIVRDSYFDSSAIEIGDPYYFSELEEAEFLDLPDLEAAAEGDAPAAADDDETPSEQPSDDSERLL
jgi:hypothetical protein